MIDLLLVGTVWTGASVDAEVGALGIDRGTVVYAGPADGAPPARDRREVAFAMPGFVDAHVHLQDGGLEAAECSLVDEPDADAILEHVARCVADTPGRRWVVGSGWDLTAFPDGNPSAAALDEVSGAHPVFLLAADGHSAWVNSAALARVDTAVDPPGGRFERDPAGRPTGTLREAAVDPMYDLLPSPGRAERAAAIRWAVAEAHRVGITGALEAYADLPALRAFRAAARRGELTVRLSVALETDAAAGAGQARRLGRLGRRFDGEGLRVRTAKVFVDGVLESRTAAMLEPYVDTGARVPPDWSGPALRELAAALHAEGLGLHLHAIGDLAVRIGLDAAETGCAVSIAHLEAIDPADVPRFAALGVAPVFQPLWAWPDEYVRDLTWPGVSPELGARLYPVAEVARTGAALAFGSDWSVSSLDPLDGIEVAVTRADPDGVEEGTLGEGIGVAEAMLAYTKGAAAVAGVGGPLAVGAPADLVVLEADPRAVSPASLSELRVLETFVGGRSVHVDGPPAR